MSSQIIGVVVITRHGDRQGFYQDPTTYTATGTSITPLGELQEYQSGAGVRARYLEPASPDYIANFSSYIPNLEQLDIRADAGDEGYVILDSAYAFMQGLYPANATASSIALANGTTVTSPLGGFVFVPVESVESAEDITLEGFTSCPTFATRNTAFYNSTQFLQVQQQAEPFLNSLKPIVGNRSVALSNIFDFMNVQNIHNATFHNVVTPNMMEQIRALCNYHEYGVFSDTTPSGIGNIGGQTILQPIMQALASFQNASEVLRMQYLGVSYKPFISLFNMTQVANYDMVDYASVMTYEIRNTTSGYTIRMNFRNGTATATDGSDIVATPMFGSSSVDYPLASFISNLQPYTINNLTQWCNTCNQTSLRGCNTALAAESAMASPSSSGSGGGSHEVSPPVAGVIGAVVALAVAGILAGLWAVFTRKRNGGRSPARGADDTSKDVHLGALK